MLYHPTTGSKLGGLGSGFLYICFSLSSFLFAKPFVAAVGPANGLLFGVVGYCVYIAGFLFAVIFRYIVGVGDSGGNRGYWDVGKWGYGKVGIGDIALSLLSYFD